MTRPSHIRLPTTAVLAALAAVAQTPNAAAFAPFTEACGLAFAEEGLDAAGNPRPTAPDPEPATDPAPDPEPATDPAPDPEPATDPAIDPNSNASALAELDALTAEDGAGAPRDPLAGWGDGGDGGDEPPDPI